MRVGKRSHLDWQAPRALEELGARLAKEPRVSWEWIERLQDAQSVHWSGRSRGAVATPWRVAERMAERLLLRVRPGKTLRILDAGCANGRLLGAVARSCARRGLQCSLDGIEVNASSARWAQALEPLVRSGARASLIDWNVQHADFLLGAGRRNEYDAVIANPPYVSFRELEPAYKDKLRKRFGDRARGDLAVVFVWRLLESLRSGGRLCVIVPNKLLAARYAASLRARLLEETCVEEIWDLSATRTFPGHGSYPVILVVRKRRAPRGHTIVLRDAGGKQKARWNQKSLCSLPGHLLPLGLAPEVLDLTLRLLSGPKLGDTMPIHCGVAVGGFGRCVGSGPDQIIRSGDVEPFHVLEPARFAPARAGVSQHSMDRQRRAKIVVPGMFRRLCAAFDAKGHLVGRVYFVPIEGATPRERALRRGLLLALLNSRLYAVLYAGLFGAVAQSGGYLRLNAPYLACLPWPEKKPGARLLGIVKRFEKGPVGDDDQEALDTAVEKLFGLAAPQRQLLARVATRLPPVVDSSALRRASGIRRTRSGSKTRLQSVVDPEVKKCNNVGTDVA